MVDTDGELVADNIMTALDIKPTSVSVRASSLVFQTYAGGVLTSSLCGWSINHAIMAVGYNADAQEPYYIVRNSWGASWGQGGYIQLGVTQSGPGVCGINQYVAYPMTQPWTE